MLALLVALLASPALAQEPGFYHAASIAARSATYRRASEGAGAAFRQREARAQAVGAALEEYRVSLDLLGARAPAAEVEALQAWQRRYNRERAVLEAFASTMLEDFDQQFVTAMKRALPARAVACDPMIASGPKLPGLPMREEKNPACKGPDLSAEIAGRMDTDPALRKAVDEILQLTWPDISLEPAAAPVVGGAGAWIPVSALHKPLARPLMKIQQQDEEARTPFAAALEEGASKEQLAAFVSQARAVDADTAAKRAALAAPAFTASDRLFVKWAKKGTTVAWCARPALLGGCAGEPADASRVQAFFADKKVAAALAP